MRLAVVSPFVDRRHGTERALAELLERLAGVYGCEIHLYAQRVADVTLTDPQAIRSTECGVIFWHKVPSLPGPHLIQFLSWILFNGFSRWWDRVFRRRVFDLTLSPGINCFHADVVLVHALFHRLKELAQEKSNDSSFASSPSHILHRRMYYGLLTRLERSVYTDPDISLAAVSERTADLLAHYFGRRHVRVIPNGVNAAQFSPANRLSRRAAARAHQNFREGDFVLLLIGNDWRVKGLEAVFQAMARFPGLPLHLVIVGSDASDCFRATAERLDILGHCHWESPGSDVMDFYAAADVYVSPSLEDSFGLPVLEAMACGLPVVTSPFAGVAELIHDGADGFILPEPRDSLALAQLLEKLCKNTPLREQVGNAAAKTALEWTWDRNAASVWRLLQEVDAQQ